MSKITSGGIGTYVDIVARELSKRGHEIYVLSPVIFNNEDCQYKTYKIEAELDSKSRRLDMSKAFYKCLKEIDHNSPLDIIEATDWGMEGFECIKQDAFNTIIRFHTPNSLVTELNNENRFQDTILINDAETFYFENAKWLTSPSQAMARRISSSFNIELDRIKIIPNPIEISDNNISNLFVEKPIRIGFLGRLERRKGVYILAKALENLFKENHQIVVDFIGGDTRTAEGSVGKLLRKKLSRWLDKVNFLGHQTGLSKIEAIKRCSCIILPSLWENFPYACLEAMAYGKVVIGTKGSGFEEIIDSDQNGFLVPPNNHKALERMIIRILQDKPNHIGCNAIKRVKDFNTTSIIPKLEAYYKWILVQSQK
jgi:glycosyltransferase involved in cell wall biosynthesis